MNKKNKNYTQEYIWNTKNIPKKIIQFRKKYNLGKNIDLSKGEPHLPIDNNILQAFLKKIKTRNFCHKLHYSPIAGRKNTLISIQNLYKLYYRNVQYKLDELMCTNGANQAIDNALACFLGKSANSNNQVILIEPYFPNYKTQIIKHGGIPIKVSTGKKNFRLDNQALLSTLQQHPHARVLLFNNPNNPTGYIYRKDEIQELVKILNIFPHLKIIVDEVYRELSYHPFISILDICPTLKTRCIVVNSCSKGLIGAPGLRIGMVGAKNKYIEKMSSHQILSTASVSLLSQWFLREGINIKMESNCSYIETHSIEKYKWNLDIIMNTFKHSPIEIVSKPDAGFFLLLNFSYFINKAIPQKLQLDNKYGKKITIPYSSDLFKVSAFFDDNDIAQYCKYIAGVNIIPGSTFGIDSKRGIIRVSYAKDKKQLTLACKRLLDSMICL